MKIVLYQCDWCGKRQEPTDDDFWPQGWGEVASACGEYSGLLCVECRHAVDAAIADAIAVTRAKRAPQPAGVGS